MKTLNLKDFITIVPFEEIMIVMNKRMYKKFLKFMNGQTVHYRGVFPRDLNRFLKGLEVTD